MLDVALDPIHTTTLYLYTKCHSKLCILMTVTITIVLAHIQVSGSIHINCPLWGAHWLKETGPGIHPNFLLKQFQWVLFKTDLAKGMMRWNAFFMTDLAYV